MIFYFVRHGETDWNVQKKIQGKTDVPLNENGLRQAGELADKLVAEGYRIEKAYTSPQIRAQVTAQAAAEALGIECISLEGLREMNFGDWEGDNWPNIEKCYGEFYRLWNSHRRYRNTPNGESYNELLRRVFRALEYIMNYEKGNVLVVSHSAIMFSLQCYVAGLCMDDETMLNFRAKNAEVIEITEEEIKEAMKRFWREEQEYKRKAEKEMDFLKLAEERYSVRSFTDKAVTQEDLDKILKAGHLAPTACNFQPQRILVIRSEEAIEKLKGCTRCHFNASTALLVCYSKEACWKRKYDGAYSGQIDASIVTTHMMLEAANIGVGSTWVMHFNPTAMREAFLIPEDLEPVALLVMGYPAEDAAPISMHSEFKELNEIVKYNEF